MRSTPIFDTNIFGDVQRSRISQADWKYLLGHRPRKGWPLSSVTAFELLAGLDAASPKDFLDVRSRIALAYHLCNGHVLEDPRYLICKEILRIPPPVHLPSFSRTAAQYMDVIRRANSTTQLLKTGVPYKGRKAKIDTTAILTVLMAGPKNAWIAMVERVADEKFPAWRDLYRETNRRLPPEMKKALEPRSAWTEQRPVFVRGLLEWLGASCNPDTLIDLSTKLDAAFEFAAFVTREFLLRNYSLQKHQSDIFDLFQLEHLAIDRFVIVTGDPDLVVRTKQSPQANRIMSFEQFLTTLPSHHTTAAGA